MRTSSCISLHLFIHSIVGIYTLAAAESAPPQPIAVFWSGLPENVGHNVATDGRLVLLGTGRNAAYLFDPLSQQTLAHFDIGRYNDQIGGTSVAIQNSTAVLGSSEAGASVFDFSNLSSIARRELTPTNAPPVHFGMSVDLDGDTIIVGGNGDGTEVGAAYLFDRTTGQEFAKLTAPDGDVFDSFGYSVAVHGSDAVVGAIGATNAFGDQGGAAYAFRADPGYSGQRFSAKSSGMKFDRNFGFSVDVFEGLAAVAGHEAAYLWDLPNQTTQLDESQVYPESSTSLVSIYDNLIAVGFFREECVRLYDRQGNVVARLQSPSVGTSYFGSSVALSGDLLVVGAPLFNGAAYVYRTSDLMVPEPTSTTYASGVILTLAASRIAARRRRHNDVP